MNLFNLDKEKEASREFAREYVNKIPEISASKRQKMYDEIIPLLLKYGRKML
jgi:hypothetical protein